MVKRLLAFTLLILLGMTGLASAAIGPVTLASDPDFGPPGSLVTLTGAGFLPDDVIRIVWRDPLNFAIDHWQTVADSNGDFTFDITVPVDATPNGVAKIKAFSVSDSVNYRATTPFYVSSAALSADQIYSTFVCSTSNSIQECIYINGSGLHVAYVSAYTSNPNGSTLCGTIRLLKGGVSYRTVSGFCITAHTTKTTTWNLGADYPNNTVLCTQFTSNGGTKSGKPCGTVHS